MPCPLPSRRSPLRMPIQCHFLPCVFMPRNLHTFPGIVPGAAGYDTLPLLSPTQASALHSQSSSTIILWGWGLNTRGRGHAPPSCHLPQVNAQHSFPFVSGWHAPRDTESVASRQSSVQEDIALHHPVTSIWGDEPVPWLPRSHAWGCDIGNNTQSPLWSSVDQSWLAGRPSRHQHHHHHPVLRVSKTEQLGQSVQTSQIRCKHPKLPARLSKHVQVIHKPGTCFLRIHGAASGPPIAALVLSRGQKVSCCCVYYSTWRRALLLRPLMAGLMTGSNRRTY